MIGICGVGMTAIAQVLQGWGKTVSGSDVEEEFPTHAVLARLGIPVVRGFEQGIPTETEVIIASTAYGPTNPQFSEAVTNNIPIVRYDEALAALTHGKRLIAVTGTHGKTTTTSMIGRIFEEAGYDPTVIVGAMVKEWGSNARVGKGEWMVVEADEYQEKFKTLRPEILVITAIDWDHPDYFKDPESYRQAFTNRIQTLPQHSVVVGYGDDVHVLEVLHDGHNKALTYGRAHHRDRRIIEESRDGAQQVFYLTVDASRVGPFHLSVLGLHMVSNAAAAISVALEVGVPLAPIRRALESFQGAGRRMEYIGTLPNGAIIMDDYAHHPVEVASTLSALKSFYPDRVLHVVFQAHTYSRTQALLEEFTHAFSDADEVIITDIFASARESVGAITSLEFTQAIQAQHPSVRFVAFGQLEESVRTQASSKDLWVFMGAGDGWKVARALVASSGTRLDSFVDERHNSRSDQLVGTTVAQIDHNRPLEQPLAQTDAASSKKNPGGSESVTISLETLVGKEKVEENILLAKYTTFRIGGPARWLVHARSKEDIIAVANFSKEKGIPLCILSGGSNVLISDKGWNGIVVRCEDRSLEIQGTTVIVGSGVPLLYLATETARQGLLGAEFCATIPGAIGGAVRGNAGAFGCEMKDIVTSIEVWDGENIRVLNGSECEFRYRSSALKDHNITAKMPWIVLSATLELQRGDCAKAQEYIKEILAKKATTQSIEKPSAGCLFKNIEITSDFWLDPTHRQWENRLPGEFKQRRFIPAAWLIDHAELKGKRIGGVEVSSKHANFVNNVGNARAEDVIMLISIIKQKIRTKYGVQLEEEVEMVGF